MKQTVQEQLQNLERRLDRIMRSLVLAHWSLRDLKERIGGKPK